MLNSGAVTVHRIDPLRDPRWTEFIERHRRASVFHTPEWLEALRRTYGYEPVALTTSAPGQDLTNGMVFCRIRSWLSGRRMVSLPFSDHCQPLVGIEGELEYLVAALEGDPDASKWRYVELRPVDALGGTMAHLEKSETFCFHRLDLGPSSEELFRRFHKNSVQKMIRRAQREALVYEDGRSETLVQKFYQLHIQSRRRQGIPPQPLVWFRNLIECMDDKLRIRVASKDGHPVASIITLRYKDTMVYKYGCSDKSVNNLGGTQLLLWKAIEEAKRDGLLEFDLGQSNWDTPGLIVFKDRWGAARSELTYLRRCPTRRSLESAAIVLSGGILAMSIIKQITASAPRGLVSMVGRALYRHLG